MIITQYLIARRDIRELRGEGFMAAQIAHASMAFLTNLLRQNMDKKIEEVLDSETKRWVSGNFNKIVLEVPDRDKMNIILDRLDGDGIKYVPIYDTSETNELTCIGLKPYDKGRVAPYFRSLKFWGSPTESTK